MLPMTFPDIGQWTGLVLMKIVGLRPDLSTKIDVIVTGFVLTKIARIRKIENLTQSNFAYAHETGLL